MMSVSDNEIRSFCESNNYLENGTKQACLIAKQIIKLAKNCPETGITKEQTDALRVLIAAVFDNQDEIPTRWCCDPDCNHNNPGLCMGEMRIDINSDKLCPYFSDPGNI